MARDRKGEDFVRRFKSAELLDELLAAGGSLLSTPEVVERMREGLLEKLDPAAVIPTLFDEEPRFRDPALARELYQNLLGLWDLLQSGKALPAARPLREAQPKKAKPTPPPHLMDAAPSAEFVAAAARYLREDPRARERLLHSFENRQDALLVHLDEQPLSDNGYGVLRTLLSELHAMLELGWGEGPRAVNPAQLSRLEQEVPELAPLKAYADEALLRAGQDAEAPLSPEEAQAVRDWTWKSLCALWRGGTKGR